MKPLIDTTANPAEWRTCSRCSKCQGSGVEIELRVLWKIPRLGLPSEKHWRRVASEEQAAEQMEALRDQGAMEVECLSGAMPCSCRKALEAPKPVGRPKGKSLAVDWKTLAVGDS